MQHIYTGITKHYRRDWKAKKALIMEGLRELGWRPLDQRELLCLIATKLNEYLHKLRVYT